ncbi:homocysteine S-methyltransferase family protein [Vibrio sp.]|nr:homocysteine S-methyltransferase family protein [Vibrio sp.]
MKNTKKIMHSQITVLDGGMGRELQRLGAPFSQPHWSADALIKAPEFVIQAHQNFIDAGAEIITVNAYACVPFHLGQSQYHAEGVSLAQSAAKLAHSLKETSTHNFLIAGCLPPPFGSYRADLFKHDEGMTIYHDLYQAQQDYVDLWLIETLSSINELNAVMTMFASLPTGTIKPVHLCFTLDDESMDTPKLRSGETLKSALDIVFSSSLPSGVMLNCSIPEVMEAAIKEISSAENRCIDIGVYANAFTPIKQAHEANSTLQEVRDINTDEYLHYVERWIAAGATIIGGCCGITPEHIQTLSQYIRHDNT